MDYDTRVVMIGEIAAKLAVWDTSGCEKYQSITRSYYRNVSAVMIAFDLTRIETFQNCKTWVKMFEEHGSGNLEKTSIVVIGNKADLKTQRAVSKEQAE